MAQYYLAIVTRDLLLKGKQSEADLPSLMWCEQVIEDKAMKGIGEALFTFGKELYQHIRKDPSNKAIMPDHLLKAQEFLEKAAGKGSISSAFFFLGIMAIEGHIVEKDTDLGI